MIYLLSQMLLSIVFALAAGGGIGWLLQRSRSNASVQALQATVVQQRLQVDQARTDVSLVTQDFDELKSHTRDEIEQLRQENRRIPSLLQNLEKSQTLVRQLMQKHEAQLRDLAHQKEGLQARVAALNERETSWQATSAELDVLRLQLAGSTLDESFIAPTDRSDPGEDCSPSLGDDRDTRLAARPVPVHAPVPDTSPAQELSPARDVAPTSDSNAASGDEPARSNWASARLSDTRLSSTPSGDESESRALMRSMGLDFSTPEVDSADELRDELRDESNDTAAPFPEAATVQPAESSTIAGSSDNEVFEDDDFDPEDEEDPDDVEQLFDAVDRHDDLKRIFGIGPVTEKALNQLGITSYSQLAELEHHEIESIASALQIFPSRIERDDWVGNARRQLEDVLEEL